MRVIGLLLKLKCLARCCIEVSVVSCKPIQTYGIPAPLPLKCISHTSSLTRGDIASPGERMDTCCMAETGLFERISIGTFWPEF